MGNGHLWYVSGAIFAALSLLVVRKLPFSLLFASVILLFSVGVLLQYAGNYHLFDNDLIDKILNKNWVHRNFVFLSYPFFCIGYFIRRYDIDKKVSYKTVYLCTGVGLSLLIVESWVNYLLLEENEAFDNIASLIVFCPALFLLFAKKNIKGKSKNIAVLSSAIYFVHPGVISCFREFTTLNDKGAFFTALIFVIVPIVSVIVIRINRKIGFIL